MNILALIIMVIIVGGCAATPENRLTKADKAEQTNSAEIKDSITIMSVLPTKIQVDNLQAQFARSVSGSVTRGLGGRFGGMGSIGMAGTSLDDAPIASSPGYMLPEKVSVDGVSIRYTAHHKVLTFEQQGSVCEFQQGATLIVTTPNETRIQPNATCEKQK